MDTKKLIEELAKREELKDIPAIYTLQVATAVLEIIQSGECFFYTQEGQDLVD